MKSLPSPAAQFAAIVAITLGVAPRALAQLPVSETPVEPVTVAPVAPEVVAPPPSTEPLPAAPPSAAAATTQPAPARTEQLIEPRDPEAERSDEDDVEHEAESAAKSKRRWYGWQTLTADGASLFTVVAGAGLEDAEGPSDTLVLAGLLGYEFAPGILHFVHRNPGRAFASFGMRLGMPLAGAILGAAAADCGDADCRSRGAGVGFLLGMGGAIALDAAVLAYENAPPLDRARFMPVVHVSARRAWFGLAGDL